jgi:hypothetical protein
MRCFHSQQPGMEQNSGPDPGTVSMAENVLEYLKSCGK